MVVGGGGSDYINYTTKILTALLNLNDDNHP